MIFYSYVYFSNLSLGLSNPEQLGKGPGVPKIGLKGWNSPGTIIIFLEKIIVCETGKWDLSRKNSEHPLKTTHLKHWYTCVSKTQMQACHDFVLTVSSDKSPTPRYTHCRLLCSCILIPDIFMHWVFVFWSIMNLYQCCLSHIQISLGFDSYNPSSEVLESKFTNSQISHSNGWNAWETVESVWKQKSTQNKLKLTYTWNNSEQISNGLTHKHMGITSRYILRYSWGIACMFVSEHAGYSGAPTEA